MTTIGRVRNGLLHMGVYVYVYVYVYVCAWAVQPWTGGPS